MVEISDLNLFLGTILDSFMEKGYVSSTPSQDSEVKKVLEGKDLEGKNEGKDFEGKDPEGDLEGKDLKGRKNLEKDLEGKGFEGKDEENGKEKNLEGKDPEGNEGKDFELFKEKAKVFARNNWKRGVALAAGFALGPPIVVGVVGLLGFGSAGITVGTTAAWMMSLHRGAVGVGSLVSVLQSIGAAGLGLGGVLVSGSLGAAMANAIAKKLETNPKGLEELKKFVTISATITGDESIPTKLTFDMHHQLLTNEEVLKTFFHGFDTAKKFAKSKQFEFLVVRDDEACEKGCLALHEHLKKTYGDKYVDISRQERFVLDLNNR